MGDKILNILDYILQYKHLRFMRKVSVVLALLAFILSISITLGIRTEVLSKSLRHTFLDNYYFSFYVAFTFILAWEVASMIYTIPYSVSKSVGKQFEIMSLIILRYVFEHLGNFATISNLKHDYIEVLEIVTIVLGSILIFYLISIYYKIQPHILISEDERQQNNFVNMKKIIAVILLIVLLFFSFKEMFSITYSLFRGDISNVKLSHLFFKDMFSIMIYFDVLMILVTMWFSLRYAMVFRTSALTASTIMIRLSFTDDIFLNVLLTVLAVIFAILVTVVYKKFEGVLVKNMEKNKSKFV